MFSKILIANRGEIACRVIKTCRLMGIQTVAVYSDADAVAKHVAMADEALHIGGAAVADSYLRADRIIAAALETGAQAIHPGYGLLSENPQFVEAVQAAGLVFIGPSPDAISAMGLKDAAKSLMQKAGVPVVPGYHGPKQTLKFLAAEAEKIGYPVMIKARAGGGGKGMRLVEKLQDFKAALEGAQREGQASFGDPIVLVEKFITQPRHIEIQVFGDAHGNAVHLFERDCSLQRRHQKVIEEAPAPDMPSEVREAMGEAAINAVKAIGYQGAGTVEFIADGANGLTKDGFWFMEMNTRLQVEHPVTEAITGLDLVELQLKIAAGEALPISQNDLTINGWSFEARLYAEDVPKGFLPATGTLSHLAFPAAEEFARGCVRIDSGVRQGDEISPYYDPMIAKVIVHGESRAAALNLLTVALSNTYVAGLTTNLEFLSNLSLHEGFVKGDVDTGLIARDLEKLTGPNDCPELIMALACLGELGLLDQHTGNDPWELISGWRHWSNGHQYAALEKDGERLERLVISLGKHCYKVEHGDSAIELQVLRGEASELIVETRGRKSRAHMVVEGASLTVFADGRIHEFQLPDALSRASDDEAGGDNIIAPMPGQVLKVMIKTGEAVAKDDPLIVLEAMKMEHTLLAPRDGIVEEVLASEGENVQHNMLLLKLEPEQ